MSALEDLNKSVEKIDKGVTAFREKESGRIDELQGRVEELEAKRNAGGKTSAGPVATDGVEYGVTKKGEKVPLLKHNQSLASVCKEKSKVPLGRALRAFATGPNGIADDAKELMEELKSLATTSGASGGFDMNTGLSSELIDLVRAKLALSQVGCRTVPMTTQTLNFAKIVSDPTVGWHAEGAGDINASDPTFGQASLTAKTVVVLTKFSVELAQDALNIENILANTLAAAIAQAVDQAGLGNTTSNGPSGILSFANRNRVRNIGAVSSYDPWVDGATALLTANNSLSDIGPAIISPAMWGALGKLKTGISSDKTPLRKPDALANIPFVVSNNVANGPGSPTSPVSYMGKWADLFFGVRQDIRIQFLRELFMGSNLQIGCIVYMRCDFAAARQSSLCTLEDFV